MVEHVSVTASGCPKSRVAIRSSPVSQTRAAAGVRVGPSGPLGELRVWMVGGESQAARRGAAGGWGRRRVLALGLGGAAAVIAGGATGVELVSHGLLPGKALLDR